MSIETIQFNGDSYPAFQAEGFAAKFAFPFAEQVCKGEGVDVGCNRMDWKFPSSNQRIVYPIDPAMDSEFNATNFPSNYTELSFVFSSHMLEHVDNWVDVLNYWHTRLKQGGIVFLYLPDFSQKYWRGWNNRKHNHMLTPEIVGAYFKDQPEMWTNTFVSQVDLNNSFMVISERRIVSPMEKALQNLVK